MTDSTNSTVAARQTALEARTGAMREAFPRGLGAPALRALAEARLTTLELVATASEFELLAMHGMGPKAVRILRDALRLRGLMLRP